jgi:hypothetical protein
VYAIKDTATNIIAAFNSDSTYISGATGVTVTDAISIANFNIIDAQTSTSIVLSGGISDTAANLASAGALSAGFTAAKTQDPDVAVSVTGTVTVTELNLIDAATTGVITATVSDTAANLAALTGTGNAYTVTATDATATVAYVNTIDAATTGVITATLSDTAANLAALTGTGNAYTVTVTGTTATAANLNTLTQRPRLQWVPQQSPRSLAQRLKLGPLLRLKQRGLSQRLRTMRRPHRIRPR